MDFSFEASRQRMLEDLRKRSNWAEILPESTDARIVDIVADEIQELARYGEFLVRENKWDLAQKRSSLMKQVRAKGYSPHRKIGALGQVAVSSSQLAFPPNWKEFLTYAVGTNVFYNNKIYTCLVENSNHAPQDSYPSGTAYWQRVRTNPSTLIGIPKYTEFSSASGIKFSALSAANLTTSDDFVFVDVVQGIKKSIQYTAEGSLFEEFSVNNANIDNSKFELFVNGELWTVISDIRKAEPSEKRYQIIDEFDFSGIRILFGNDLSGKKLSVGQIVKFVFIETDGADGSITSQNGVINVDSTVTNINGEIVQLYCSNLNAIVGGKNHESMEEIRANATKFFQSGDQLVTASDYEIHLLSNYDFIGNCVVWGAYEQNVDNGNDPWDYIPTQENLVYISAYTPGDAPLDILKNPDGSNNTTYKLQLIRNIREQKPLTDIISFVPVKFIYMAFVSHLYVSDQSYLLSEVIQKVKDALWEEYPITKMGFKQNLYETNYKRFIDEVEGVDHHNTSIQLMDYFKFDSGGTGLSYVCEDEIPLFPIKPGTVKFYVRDDFAVTPVFTQVAHDNGSGVLVADTGFTLDGTSSVDYSNGLVSLSVATGLSEAYERYTIKVVYELTALNIVLTGRNQILYLSEVDEITAEYLE